MTAPDPAWVEAVARALHARYCTCGSPDRIERRNAGIAVAAVEPLIRREVLADLRAKVLMLEHDDSCSEIRQEAPCDCLRGSVLALIEEADRG